MRTIIRLKHSAFKRLLLACFLLPLPLLAQVPFSDYFTNTSLNSAWTLESPNPDSSYQMTGSGISITASWNDGGSDLYSGTEYNAPRLLQPVDPSLDWIIETELNFSPGNNYQGAGLLLASTNGTFINDNQLSRISERAYYPNGGGSVIRSDGTYVAYSSSTSYLRVQKSGTNYTGWYSSDGVNWTLNGTSTDTNIWPYIGIFVVRYPWDSVQIDSTAVFSYFKVTVTTPATVYTNFVPVSLAPVANAINSRIVNCPTGQQILGGVPFNLLPPSVNNSWDAIGNTTVGDNSTQQMNLHVNIYGATAVDMLVNTSWGNIGTLVPITFTCSDGTTYTYNLTPGAEIRDWLENTYVNALSDTSAAGPVFNSVAISNTSQPARVDMQHIMLPSTFFTRVLTNINLTDNGVTGNTDSSYSHSIGAQRAFIYGVTVAAPPVVLNIAPWTNSVILFWNTNLVGFNVQYTTNLATGPWNLLSSFIGASGNLYSLTNALGPQAEFFRLQHN